MPLLCQGVCVTVRDGYKNETAADVPAIKNIVTEHWFWILIKQSD